MRSFWALALCAALVDTLAFAAGLDWLRWANYALVWLGVQQLGYAWRSGSLGGRREALAWSGGVLTLGLGVLGFLWSIAPPPFDVASRAVAEAQRDPQDLAPGAYTTASLIGVSKQAR